MPHPDAYLGNATTVENIQAGDEFIDASTRHTVWTALENARRVNGEVHVSVRFADGGSSTRIWNDPKTTLLIVR